MSKLLAIATRSVPKEPMEELEDCEITLERGVADDLRGKPSGRQVTVLAREAWEAACASLGAELPWTTRRANLLVEEIDLAGSAGRRLRVGGALLEVTAETDPCELMDDFYTGLRAALEPDWRGGVCCRVLEAGALRIGDAVAWEERR